MKMDEIMGSVWLRLQIGSMGIVSFPVPFLSRSDSISAFHSKVNNHVLSRHFKRGFSMVNLGWGIGEL